MAATYVKVPTSIPSNRRSARITSVVAGDQINIEEILGRPARGVKIITGTTTDTITFKLNNLVHIVKRNEVGVDETIKVWNSGPAYDTFSVTGSTEHVTQEYLLVHAIEIVSLTGPANIELVVW
jgi:hypothetical protein